MDQAFQTLRTYARDHGAYLTEVAYRLVDEDRMDPREVLRQGGTDAG
ncbi:hypothetical protein [Streptomonospora alba]|nr:hypothetical protein [Streptomonospora alba]